MWRYIGLGFSAAVLGVFKASKSEGLNFNISPHYSGKDSPDKNMKAMLVTMMLTDCLDEDEVNILLNSVQFVYNAKSIPCSSQRQRWCSTEVKNFMECSERCGSIKSDKCKNFKKLLKTCLESKKHAQNIVPVKLNTEAFLSPGCPVTRAACAFLNEQSNPTDAEDATAISTTIDKQKTTNVPTRPMSCNDTVQIATPFIYCKDIADDKEDDNVITATACDECDLEYNECNDSDTIIQQINTESKINKCSTKIIPSKPKKAEIETQTDGNMCFNFTVNYDEWCRQQRATC